MIMPQERLKKSGGSMPAIPESRKDAQDATNNIGREELLDIENGGLPTDRGSRARLLMLICR
jgi:hypothetical protein